MSARTNSAGAPCCSRQRSSTRPGRRVDRSWSTRHTLETLTRRSDEVGQLSRYLHALRFALNNQANPYGFTLVVWGTGALATWQLGTPSPADVFAYLGGALVAVSLIVAGVFGVWHPLDAVEPPQRPFSAMHLASAPGAAVVGWSLTLLVSGATGFLLAAFAAAGVYQVLLAAEIAVALAPRRRHGSR